MRRSLSKLVLLLAASLPACAYSVLSHEALVDAAWDKSVKPALLARFPNATEDDLKNAHAYVYGGAIIQDMGYYPFGSHLFSDLTHYIRSGDFIVNMLREAQNLNEYAFALGSLAHYAADNAGHPSVNRSVPMLYRKVRRKFGAVATYEDNPTDHLRTEFSFDVAEVAQQHFAPEAYHSFIGFEVSKPVLERAFQKTYGIQLKDAVRTLDLALGTYRRTVSSIIPEMTRVAWKEKEKDLENATPGLTRSRFVYVMSRASFEKEWGRDYKRPGPWASFLAFLLRITPKIGPLRALAFHAPTAETQKLFMDGFVRAVALYRQKLDEQRAGTLHLENRNFDTGELARSGTYRLADEAAEKLEKKLRPEDTPADVKQALAAFFDPAPHAL